MKVDISKYPVVEVTWVDSWSNDEWVHFDTVECNNYYAVSVGYLFRRTNEVVVLCQSIGHNQVAGRMTIPVCAIKKLRYLRR